MRREGTGRVGVGVLSGGKILVGVRRGEGVVVNGGCLYRGNSVLGRFLVRRLFIRVGVVCRGWLGANCESFVCVASAFCAGSFRAFQTMLRRISERVDDVCFNSARRWSPEVEKNPQDHG